MTEEDFYRDATEDSDWEYLDGRLVMHSPASKWHADRFRFLLTLLSGYLDERGGAIVLGSRYPMRLDERWSPEPDLLVVRDDRRHLLGANRLEGPADLVIEIASDSDPGLDVREKLPRYREAGVDEIWLVNPFEQVVLAEVREPSGYAAQRLAAGRLTSRVVPRFWIDVGWLWQERLPSTLACLREIFATV
ncbi:MAG: Uma2 family endonuclease [Candidatus Rokuibacteriota bacterium]